MDDQDNKVKVSNLDILAKMPEDAVTDSLDLMHNKGTASVFFLTSECSDLCKDNSEALNLIDSCDIILPADRAMEDAVFSEGGIYEKEKDSKDYLELYFEYLCYRLQKENRLIFAVLESEESLERLKDCMKPYENIQVHGIVFKDYDNMVNEVNALIPDLLILGVSLEKQFDFLKDYKAMTNAKLIAEIPSIEQLLKKTMDSVPSLIKALHLENVYHWIRKDSKMTKTEDNH